jgi:hypothetical protein
MRQSVNEQYNQFMTNVEEISYKRETSGRHIQIWTSNSHEENISDFFFVAHQQKVLLRSTLLEKSIYKYMSLIAPIYSPPYLDP